MPQEIHVVILRYAFTKPECYFEIQQYCVISVIKKKSYEAKQLNEHFQSVVN